MCVCGEHTLPYLHNVAVGGKGKVVHRLLVVSGNVLQRLQALPAQHITTSAAQRHSAEQP